MWQDMKTVQNRMVQRSNGLVFRLFMFWTYTDLFMVKCQRTALTKWLWSFAKRQLPTKFPTHTLLRRIYWNESRKVELMYAAHNSMRDSCPAHIVCSPSSSVIIQGIWWIPTTLLLHLRSSWISMEKWREKRKGIYQRLSGLALLSAPVFLLLRSLSHWGALSERTLLALIKLAKMVQAPTPAESSGWKLH